MNGATQGKGTPIPLKGKEKVGKLIEEPVTRFEPLDKLEADLAARYGRKVPERAQYPASVVAR